MNIIRLLCLVAFFFITVFVSGCACTETGAESDSPDYARPLPPGESALRLLTDPATFPDLRAAYRNRDDFQITAIENSLRWFAAPSSRQFYPFPITANRSLTHEQARESLVAFRDLLEHSPDENAFLADLTRMFDIYQSVGYNEEGIVLYTGYYAPVFAASRIRTERFTAPLYKRPADLKTDPVTGAPLGRDVGGGRTEPYYTRREIEQRNLFAGNELVWLEDPLSAYIVQVNGSAKLRLRNGEVMYIGYAGKTDQPYTGLGESVVEEGLIDPANLSLSALKNYYRRDPQTIEELIMRNQNYVFFTTYDGSNWPAGSLGVKVTEKTTLATDKKVYPRGGVVLADTDAVSFTGASREFLRFMLDQDTGGAIQAPGRADIFMGVGPGAEILAGGQYAEGYLYYLFLKPAYVNQAFSAMDDELSSVDSGGHKNPLP